MEAEEADKKVDDQPVTLTEKKRIQELFFPKKKEGEELPAYELPDNFEEILGLSDNINKREEASIESLLFCENKVLRGEQNRKLFDKKEIKMLEEEREKYVDFLCDKFKGYFPPILEDAGLFSRACKKTKSGKRKKVNSKVDENGEEVDEDGAEDEGENFLTDDNDEGEEDDYAVNDYQGEDDGGVEEH